jgi:hypothetical protein
MGSGKTTYRKRDLKVAREIAHEGDVVQVAPDGTITIIIGRPGDSEKSEPSVTPLEGWRAKRRGKG